MNKNLPVSCWLDVFVCDGLRSYIEEGHGGNGTQENHATMHCGSELRQAAEMT